jgi:hypothetical protein
MMVRITEDTGAKKDANGAISHRINTVEKYGYIKDLRCVVYSEDRYITNICSQSESFNVMNILCAIVFHI